MVTKKQIILIADSKYISTSDLMCSANSNCLYREILDPTPDIQSLFKMFNGKFFGGRLYCVELEWSKRMYQCAGICYSRRNRMGMSCVIRLSEPLLKLRSRKDLVETLLHEMIHALNFINGIMEGNGGHGQNFLSKMNEINRQAGTNISVYHTFHDEVDIYKTHWWRCDGSCQNRKPFYGFVKRTSNRAPSTNDFWWKQHEQTCGGKFIKVKEPEKKAKGRVGKENSNKSVVKKPKIAAGPSKPKIPPASPGTKDIRSFFPTIKTPDESLNDTHPPRESPTTSEPCFSGFGITLGGKGSGKSRLLDMFEKKTEKKSEPSVKTKRKLSDDEPFDSKRKSFHDSIMADFEDDDDIILIDDEFDDTISTPVNEKSNSADSAPSVSETCHCPICNFPMAVSLINDHLDLCLLVS